MTDFIVPDWTASDHVKAFTSLRSGGVSVSPYDSLNLAQHVNDQTTHVEANRALLGTRLSIPTEPHWLEQVHGTTIQEIKTASQQLAKADGSYTRATKQVCVVLTADCLPLLICDRQGSEVAAVHAGWRGLADGVIEAALDRFQSPAQELMVWLGPAIGPTVFEVGIEVREAFLRHTENADQAFTSLGNQKYLADIYELARQRLHLRGVHAVFGGQYCTYSQAPLFYSYRRDGVTGRMATLIWLE